MTANEPGDAMTNYRHPSLPILALLALLMAATRYRHFGDAVSLPDASLAVFFLAGLLVAPVAALALLMLLAGAIDYLAIAVAGVSDYCVSPAYVFLVPAYAVLWSAGRRAAVRQDTSGRGLLRLYLAFGIAVSAAFVVSNAGFFAFSGYFPQMPVGEYATRVARYYPPYALNALGYVSLAVLVRVALARRPRAARGTPAPSAR